MLCTPAFASHPQLLTPKELTAFLHDSQAITQLLDNASFVPSIEAKTTTDFTNSRLELSVIPDSTYVKILKDDYKTADDANNQMTQLPKMMVDLAQKGFSLFSSQTAFKSNQHPYWEWQISHGKIWQNASDQTLVVLPFALQERNANCTHTGYLALSQSMQNKKLRWQGYYQISAETCAYLQFDMAGRLNVNFVQINKNYNKPIASVATTKALNITDLSKDYPQLNIAKLVPKNPSSTSVSGLFIAGKHYRLSCQNRTGNDPYCQQLVLPSYSTAKSLYAGLALMRLEKIVPNISRVAVSKLIPQCDAKQWQGVSLGDLLNMRTGLYLSKKPHVDESSSRMLSFFLAETNAKKIELACSMFNKRSPAGKYFVYHSSDTYLAGVIMNKLYQKISDKDDLFQGLMLQDLWKDLKLSALFAHSKRSYDNDQQTFTGWGLSYYISDLIQLIEFIQQQVKDTTLVDQTMLNSALQISDDRFNRSGGEANLAYNFGFWGLEVGHSLSCQKDKWMPFMSGFGGISVILYSPDIFYYHFADDYKYQWLSVVKELNKQFPVCGASKS